MVNSRYIGIGVSSPPDGSSQTFPLQASTNGRYLTTFTGAPFLLIGDSPQGMISDITPTQMVTYMSNRQGYGINCIQVHLLSGATFGGNSTTFEAEDGTTPFTTQGDIATPREAYFAQVDDLIELAASYGMVVILTAAERIDASQLWKDNGTTKCTNFGAYLGNRYKDFPNIIWNYGNDYTPTEDTALDACLHAVRDGIAGADTNHLHTAWLNPMSAYESTRDDNDWEADSDIDFVYLYTVIYSKMLEDRALTPAMPMLLGEANYEGESLMGYLTTPLVIRKQIYWAMLSGACGHTYCNEDIWKFLSGWASRLDSYPGLTHVTYLTDMLAAYDWWLLVPDNAHNILTAGYGTYEDGGSINTNDYATCAYLQDESLVLIYMPTDRTMTVSNLSGEYVCRWYDPTNGQYYTDATSPVSSWPHDFSRSGANAGGDHDWGLVLQVQ